MLSPRLDMAAVTHPGRVRAHNEDCVAADARARIAVLADGMGGHNAGEVASRIVVDVLTSGLGQARGAGVCGSADAEALLAAYVTAANRAVFDGARTRADYEGMGTTLVVALWHDEGVSYAHVGDSRLYRLRGEEFRRLTRDHSLVQDQVERGQLSAREARTAPHRNVLTRALGTDAELPVDVHSDGVATGDLYLLCSDGLTDMLSDDEIRASLLESRSAVEAAAQRLVDRANEHGGTDNISVILARVTAPEP